MPGLKKSERAWTLLWLMMLLMAAMLLQGCAKPVASETSAAICRELRLSLPSWSSRDTPETLASGARFIAVFEAACPWNAMVNRGLAGR
jgi:hypothetical protein